MRNVLPTPDLSHIAGPSGPPILHTAQILADPHGFHDRAAERFGQVYRYGFAGKTTIALRGADALQWAMEDRGGLLSSGEGWVAIAEMFPGGLMLRDGEDHRTHRRILQSAFRKQAMDGYLEALGAGMTQLLAGWPQNRRFALYPAVKALTLRLGAAVFLGLSVTDPRIDQINGWLVQQTFGAIGLLRMPGPVTAFGRGLAARARMLALLESLIPERSAGDGTDFFSQMCRARDDDGTSWTAREIAAHFNFLLMAAHDTTASTLTAMAWGALGTPQVMAQMQAEVEALPKGALTPETMTQMPYTDHVFKEALRLFPPVLFMPRRLTRDADWQGVPLPRGTYVMTNPSAVQRDPRLFPDPLRFDPGRFARGEERAHKFAWAPFGGGMHKCIGLHFGEMHARVFWASLLQMGRLDADVQNLRWRHLPTPRPKGGMPVILRPV